MSVSRYTILTGTKSYEEEAATPQEALQLFINRVRARGEQPSNKIPRDSLISLSLYSALVDNSLKLVVVSKSERPRRIFCGYTDGKIVKSVTHELGLAVQRLLTEEELRSINKS
jgi:hypothetical protein